MKRVFSLFLIISLLSMSISVNAGVYTDVDSGILDEATDFLNHFGIMKGYDDDEFKPNEKITRAEFAVCIARMLNLEEQAENDKFYYLDVPTDHWAAGSIAQLSQRGIISGYGNGYFGVNDPVRLNEAYKVAVSLIGYNIVADAKGGYPNGYVQAAHEARIDKNVISSEFITRGNMAILLFNTLNAEMMSVDFSGNNKTTMSKGGGTLLHLYHSISSVDGTVYQVPGSSIYSSKSFSDKRVMIEDEAYEVSDELHPDSFLLGKYVTAYFIDDRDENTLVYYYIHENATEDITIKSDDIDNVSNGVFSYYEKNKMKKITIPSDVKVIYNGVALESFSEDVFSIENGFIRFMKMKGSSKYDLVFIDETETVVISTIDTMNEIIYNKLGDSIEYGNKYDKIVFENEQGEEIKIEDLAVNDVLSVKRSGTNLLTAILCKKSVSGAIQSLSTDANNHLCVDIDGIKYNIVKNYEKQFSDSVKLSDIVDAKLDIYGRIAWAEYKNADGIMIGYMTKIRYVEEDEKAYCKIFTQSGELNTYSLKAKVKIDGTNFKNHEIAVNTLNALHNTAPQIIAYKLNEANEITYIDTVYRGENETSNSLQVSLPIRSYRMKESGFIGGVGVMDSEAKVFSVPTDDIAVSASQKDFAVNNASMYFRSQTLNNFETYKLSSKIGKETLAVYKGGNVSTITDQTSAMIIDHIINVWDEEECEVLTRVECLSMSGNSTFDIDPSYDISSINLKKGGVVRVAKNSRGYVNDIQTLVDIDNPPEMNNRNNYHTTDNSFDVSCKLTYGYAVEKGENLVRISYDLGGEWKEAAWLGNVMIYDKENNEFYTGTVKDILTYDTAGTQCDRIFLQYNYGQIYTAIVFKGL